MASQVAESGTAETGYPEERFDPMKDPKNKWIHETATRWADRVFTEKLDKGTVRVCVRDLYRLQGLESPTIIFADSPASAQSKLNNLPFRTVRRNICALLHMNHLEKNWGNLYKTEMGDLANRYGNIMTQMIGAQGPHAPSFTRRETTPRADRLPWEKHPMWPADVCDLPPHDYALSERNLGLLYFILAYGPTAFAEHSTSHPIPISPGAVTDATFKHEHQKIMSDFNLANTLVKLHEAGPWMMWFFIDTAVICHPPKIRYDEGNAGRPDAFRPHNELGPAIRFPDGQQSYWWRGVQVPSELITAPSTIPVRQVLKQANQEVRRAMIDRIGYERILEEVGAKVIQNDETGELIQADIDDDRGRAARFCRVKDASTNRTYLIRTDPSIKSCREGLANSVEIPPAQYEFGKET